MNAKVHVRGKPWRVEISEQRQRQLRAFIEDIENVYREHGLAIEAEVADGGELLVSTDIEDAMEQLREAYPDFAAKETRERWEASRPPKITEVRIGDEFAPSFGRRFVVAEWRPESRTYKCKSDNGVTAYFSEAEILRELNRNR